MSTVKEIRFETGWNTNTCRFKLWENMLHNKLKLFIHSFLSGMCTQKMFFLLYFAYTCSDTSIMNISRVGRNPLTWTIIL